MYLFHTRVFVDITVFYYKLVLCETFSILFVKYYVILLTKILTFLLIIELISTKVRFAKFLSLPTMKILIMPSFFIFSHYTSSMEQ